jgi:tripartite-type tricarboxylate transporter receptor subunit TctC
VKRRQLIIAGASALAAPAVVRAEGKYPERTIRLVVPFAPAGPTDIIGRKVAEKLTITLGQTMIVDNKAGAAGAIGAELVKQSPPDGYTLMFTNSTTMMQNKVLFKKLPYDPDKDFVLISWMSAGHLPMIVNKDVPAKNLKEFADYARANKVSLGTYGAGSYSHVAVEAVNRHYGLAMQAAHYRGEALMWQDVASGSVQGGSGSYAAASSVLQSGTGRPIAVPSRERMRKLPDVATFYEQGVTDQAFLVRGWIGLFGPAGMPAGIVQKLSDMMVEGGKTERIQKILDTFGIDESARDCVYLKKAMDVEGPVWIELVKGLNLEPQ